MNGVSTCTSAAGPIPAATTWPTDIGAQPTGAPAPCRPLHRLREVRRREGIHHSKIARHLGVSIRDVQQQERPTADMRLSDLYRWAEVLEVPATELLHEPDGALSPPVQLRAQLVRVMKTVRSIQESARQTSIRRLSDALINQLVEVMPELKDTVAWPTLGHQRKRNELGAAFFRGLSIGQIDESDLPES
jgi:transcriptional regulator with XRE-family HTH domain